MATRYAHLAALILTACGGDGSGSATDPEVPAFVLSVLGDGQRAGTGGTLQDPLVLTVTRSGSPSPNVAVTWEIVEAAGPGAALADAEVTTDVSGEARTGLVLGESPGSYRVRASLASGESATFSATAELRDLASLSVLSGNGQSGTVGAPLAQELSVAALDQFGDPVEGATVRFQVTRGASAGAVVSPDLVETDAEGRAAASLTLGTRNGTYRARAEAAQADVDFDATAEGGVLFLPELLSVAAAALVEGQVVVLEGLGFEPLPEDNTVLVDGIEATVTAATSTSLTVTVPTFDCRPARSVLVRVEARGDTTEDLPADLRPADLLNLEVGQWALTESFPDGCVQLPAAGPGGADYLLGVSSPAQLGLVVPFRLEGVMAGDDRESSAVPMAFKPGLTRDPEQFGGTELSPYHRLQQQLRQLHGRSTSFATARPGATRAEPVPEVGDIVEFRFPDTSATDLETFCSNFGILTTVVMAVGERGIFVADLDNPTDDALTGSDMSALSDLLDDQLAPVLDENFGALSDIDDNGRIIILFTRRVNEALGIGGIVLADLDDPADCAASNTAEMLYLSVPDPMNQFGSGSIAKQDLLDFLPGGLAHEVTHVIQNGRQLSGGMRLSRWEEEGQATLATEVFHRSRLGIPTRGDDGPEIAAMQMDMARFISRYFGWDPVAQVRAPDAPELCSLFGFIAPFNDPPIPCTGFAYYYQAAWSFLRYVTDHFGPTFPGGEAGLHRALISANPTLSGTSNIEAVLGVDFSELFFPWAAMLLVDGRVEGLPDELQMLSWNLDRTWEARAFPDERPGALELPLGSFDLRKAVRAGSTFYLELSSAQEHDALAVRLREVESEIPEEAIPRLWVVRTR